MGRLPRHLTLMRRERLRDLLTTVRYLPVARVCELLGVSEATARRDLAELARQRLVQRTHGGALCPYAGDLSAFERFFPAFEHRRARQTQGKAAIAEAAVRLLRPGMTVFLDAGTTCYAIAEAMEGHLHWGAGLRGGAAEKARLTVLTQNLAAAIRLAAVDAITVELLGGTLLLRQAASFGDDACRAVSGRMIDVAFVGAEGLTGQGVWNSQADVVRLQRAALAAAQQRYFVLDASKLGATGPILLSAWSDHGLVTDARASVLRKHGIDLPAQRLVLARSARRAAPADDTAKRRPSHPLRENRP